MGGRQAGEMPRKINAFLGWAGNFSKRACFGDRTRQSVFLACSRKERRPRARRWPRPLL